MKRVRTFRIKAVPHATPFICLDTSKDTPTWLLERLFPSDEDQILSLENSIFHLSALNYFSTLAAKRHHESALYVARWLEKAFKLWKYVDNSARHSFMRKQTRLAESIIANSEFELTLHHLGASETPREFYDAVWPQIEITAEEAEELREIIDQRQLNRIYERCEDDEGTVSVSH